MFKTATKSKKTNNGYKHYSFLVGSVAETLIEQLFLSLDYDVFPFGMENTVPEMKTRLRGNTNKVSSQIRNMPDFVVMRGNSNPIFIEVKFRESGKFNNDDLLKMYKEYPYSGVLVVLVSTKHIKAEFVERLKEYPITPTSKNFLGNVKELEFTKEEKTKIISFCEYAKHFFTDVSGLK